MLDSHWQKSSLLAVAAFFGGAAGTHVYEHSSCPALPLRLQDYACFTTEAEAMTALPSLEDEVRDLLEAKASAGELMRVGVLFQRLRDGSGFGIGDEQLFVPASMLKLPVAFSILTLEAQEPGTLEQELLYAADQATGCTVLAQDEVSVTGLEVGRGNSLESLLRAVIVHSDNLSYCILVGHMNADSERRALLLRTFRELGVDDPDNTLHEAATVREYAGLFRLLYNTAYLDAAGSAKLLAWLIETSYDKGLSAGVPADIHIANKFGERVANDGTRYLHDCGIVYAAADPYVLCVMTKGLNFSALQATLSEVSAAVYSAVAEGSR